MIVSRSCADTHSWSIRSSVDPVYSGGANAYEYCGANPIGCTDLSGATEPAVSRDGLRGASVAVLVGVGGLLDGPAQTVPGLSPHGSTSPPPAIGRTDFAAGEVES
jgi:hypothetical protein